MAEPEYFEALGLKIPEDGSILRRGHKKALLRGNYEKPERNAVNVHIKETDKVVELGAGIGFMSTFMAVTKGVKNITTFEANPALLPFIKKMHALNNVSEHITVRNELVAPAAGEAMPFYVRGNFLASSMSDDMGTRFGGVVSTEMIDVVDFNEFLKSEKPNALVCDVEGYESILFPQCDLTSIDKAIIELHPASTGIDGIKAVFDAFSNAGMAYDCETSTSAVVTFLRV